MQTFFNLNLKSFKTAMLLTVVLGFAQGLLAYLLVDIEEYSYSWLPLLYALFVFVLLLGYSFILNHDRENFQVYLWRSMAGNLLFSVVVYWVASVYATESQMQLRTVQERLVVYFFLLPFLWLFLQEFFWLKKTTHNRETFYQNFYNSIWKFVSAGLIGAIFAGLYWLLICLWVGLFSILKIKLFEELFFSKSFSIITLFTAQLLGTFVAMRREKMLVAVQMLLSNVVKYLTPILIVSIIAFLFSILITGLKPLWETSYASALLLSVIIILVVLTNIIIQKNNEVTTENEKQALPKAYRRLVELSFFSLPLLSAIVFYGIFSRINQYGLTPERLYVVILAVFTSIFSVGYPIAVFVKRNDSWLSLVKTVNIFQILFLAFLFLLFFNPVFDVFKLSAKSQYQRIAKQNELAEIEKIDFQYFYHSLGIYGHQKLKLLAEHNDTQSKKQELIRLKAQSALKGSILRHGVSDEKVVLKSETFAVKPAGLKIPKEFLASLQKNLSLYYQQTCMAKPKICMVYQLDLDDDRIPEYVVFTDNYNYLQIFASEKNAYQHIGSYYASFSKGQGTMSNEKLRAKLQKDLIATKKQRYHNLVLDGHEFIFQRIDR